MDRRPVVGQLYLSLPRGKVNPRLPAPSESQIEKAVCTFLRIKGYFFWKSPSRGYFSGRVSKDNYGRKVMIGSFQKDQNPFTRCGTPDIVLVYRGRYIGFEVKSPTGRQTEAQIDFQRDLEKAGGLYFLVRSIEDVQRALETIDASSVND